MQIPEAKPERVESAVTDPVTPDLDRAAINVIRGFALDAPLQAKSGHQGTALALAPRFRVNPREVDGEATKSSVQFTIRFRMEAEEAPPPWTQPSSPPGSSGPPSTRPPRPRRRRRARNGPPAAASSPPSG